MYSVAVQCTTVHTVQVCKLHKLTVYSVQYTIHVNMYITK